MGNKARNLLFPPTPKKVTRDKKSKNVFVFQKIVYLDDVSTTQPVHPLPLSLSLSRACARVRESDESNTENLTSQEFPQPLSLPQHRGKKLGSSSSSVQ